jgi:hypothetical protein
MVRREFIQLGLGSVAMAAAMPLFGGCSGLVRSDLEREPVAPANPNLDSRLAEVLRLASLAPSGHNTQPWRVELLDEGRLRIHADAARSLPVVDPDNREMLIGLGAFLESLVLAAGIHGLRAQMEPTLQQAGGIWQQEVVLHNAQPSDYPAQRLELRRTLRSGFRTQELSAELLSKLQRHAGCDIIYLPRNSRESSLLAEATTAAFSQQTWNDAAQEELASWIRFSNDDARRHRDGLTPAMMGITGFGGWFVRSFYDRSDVLKKGFRDKGIEGVSQQVKEGAGWLILTDTTHTSDAMVSTGRRFQRLASCAREFGLALHPMSQTIEEAPWKNELWSQVGLSTPAHLVLRCGLVDQYPPPSSLRRPVAAFVPELYG